MRVYADYAATTPVLPNVTEKITEMLKNHYGNASSIHALGRESRKYLDGARMEIAKLLHAKSNEVIFTSGATESNNTAIKGLAKKQANFGKHIITSKVEHHSVLHVFEQLELEGFEVTYLNVDKEGKVSLSELEDALRPDTTLVSIMLVNNEVGTVQPMFEIGELLLEKNIYFHVDAVQAIGHLEVDFDAWPVTAISITAHKFGGPKGIGLLLMKDGVNFENQQHGGDQESKRRAGTENIPYICGMSLALNYVTNELNNTNIKLMGFKEQFLIGLQERSIPFVLNGSMTDTTGHIINLYFPFVETETMLTLLDMNGIYVSSGSACTAGTTIPSHVLKAMYGEDEIAKHSVRFSFSGTTTEEEIQYILTTISKIYHQFKEDENE